MKTLKVTYRIEKTQSNNKKGFFWNVVCNETGFCVGAETRKEATELMKQGGWDILDNWKLTEAIKLVDKFGEWEESPRANSSKGDENYLKEYINK